eukprot:SAG31_NODE_3431_length_4280_cov_4.502033_2_plen_75_part_00
MFVRTSLESRAALQGGWVRIVGEAINLGRAADGKLTDGKQADGKLTDGKPPSPTQSVLRLEGDAGQPPIDISAP